jgi:hypothetical protein
MLIKKLPSLYPKEMKTQKCHKEFEQTGFEELL